MVMAKTMGCLLVPDIYVSLDGLSAESTDESHRNRDKGRKVPLDWLVDVVPVPGSKGCLADGVRVSPNGVWKLLQTKILFAIALPSSDTPYFKTYHSTLCTAAIVLVLNFVRSPYDIPVLKTWYV